MIGIWKGKKGWIRLKPKSNPNIHYLKIQYSIYVNCVIFCSITMKKRLFNLVRNFDLGQVPYFLYYINLVTIKPHSVNTNKITFAWITEQNIV